jgi:hypothetical protein
LQDIVEHSDLVGESNGFEVDSPKIGGEIEDQRSKEMLFRGEKMLDIVEHSDLVDD